MGAFNTTSALLLLGGLLLASIFGNSSNVVLFLSAAAILYALSGVVAFILLRDSRPEPEAAPRRTGGYVANTTAD
jgi:hypothetical protein